MSTDKRSILEFRTKWADFFIVEPSDDGHGVHIGIDHGHTVWHTLNYNEMVELRDYLNQRIQESDASETPE